MECIVALNLSVHPRLRGEANQCASVAVRAEKRANKNVKIRLLFSETETAKQNQKFPFHFFFRFAVEGWGEEAREKCKEIFGFCTRESASVSEAHCIASPRNRSVRGSFKSPRAPRVRFSPRQDSAQNTFELRSIHTAKIRNQKKRTNRGRREAPTLMYSPRRIQNPKGFSTLRVARRLPIQIYE